MWYYLIMPVGLALSFLLFSFVFYKRLPKTSRFILGLAILFIYVLSTKYFVYQMGVLLGEDSFVKNHPALSLTDLPKIDPATTAIVVLGNGRYSAGPEFGKIPVTNNMGLNSLRYASRLHKLTAAPILLSGNSGGGDRKVSEAELMYDALKMDFGIKENIWLETKSSSTYENAKFSAKILQKKNIKTVILVTNRGQMERAIRSFSKYPFKIIPAPLGYYWGGFVTKWTSFLPISVHFAYSADYWHQLLAMVYYKTLGRI